MVEHLVLDPAIRNWVVLPLIAMVVLMGFGRAYVMQLMKREKKAEPTELRHRQTLARAARLRGNGHWLRRDAFAMRKQYLVRKEGGLLREKVESAGAPNPMADPSGMQAMLTQNVSMMLPQILSMGLLSYFFSGFVLVKIPFPLTQRFKLMLQRGVELTTLDVSYVSSLSWYFLAMFGLRGFFGLMMGDKNATDDAAMMQRQMGMGGGAGNPMQQFDAKKAFRQERDSLNLVKHRWSVDTAEHRMLGVAPPPVEAEVPVASADIAPPVMVPESAGSGSGSSGSSGAPAKRGKRSRVRRS